MGFTDIISSLFRMPAKMLAALSVYSNRLRFVAEGVTLGRNSRIRGWVKLVRKRGASIVIGDGFNFTSGLSINRISRSQTGCICAEEGASIIIGDNVGMSSPCLWSRTSITVGNNVNIGACCVIMDHDAHSLDYVLRRNRADELGDIASAPIVIGDDVLIGTGCYILKGVTIGERSIIGAGSVVTRDVPPGEIWAGNPARFIRKI
ncbi:MAG: acyltransferase [Candidatus Cryptobacteroides sp.]